MSWVRSNECYLVFSSPVVIRLYPVADTMVCTGCCATLDNIITYLFRRLTVKKKKTRAGSVPDSESFLRILELHPEILQQVGNITTGG